MSHSFDINALLDPEIAAAIDGLDLGFATLSNETLADVRAGWAALPRPEVSDLVARTDHVVTERPTVSVHGGGLVVGSNIGDDPRFDKWCPALNCVGVSVEYELAPESKYPGPLEDCYAGLAWVHANAQELGIDVNRIGIGGSSAGAGLASGLALLARDRGELPIAMLDDRQITTSSQWADPIWPPQANRFGWDSYLGDLSGDAVPIYAAAARATQLQNLPPTFICVGALDGFSDEDVDYSTRLRHAGVPCELHVYPGAPHGFDSVTPNSAVAQRAARELEQWLRTQFDA
jgi:acetyl esterase/lipase